MAVITNRTNLVEKLLKHPPSPGVVARLIRHSSTEMVLDSRRSRVEWKRILASMGHQTGLDRLDAFVDSLVTCDGGGQLEDRRIAKVEAGSLEDLFDSENWQEAVVEHQGNTKNRERRDEAFGRFFGHLLAPHDSELQVFDTYFLAKALKRAEIVDWLFTQVASRGTQKLTIWTEISSESQFGGTSKEIAQRFGQVVHEGLSAAGFQGFVKLVVFDKHPHDRYVAIKFKNGRVAFTLGYGIDLFKDNQIVETAPVVPMPHADLEDVMKSDALRPSQFQTSLLGTHEASNIRLEIHVPDSWN